MPTRQAHPEKIIVCQIWDPPGGDDGDGGTIPANPTPLPNVGRDQITRSGSTLTPIPLGRGGGEGRGGVRYWFRN